MNETPMKYNLSNRFRIVSDKKMSVFYGSDDYFVTVGKISILQNQQR
jgi:hypothetical protein